MKRCILFLFILLGGGPLIAQDFNSVRREVKINSVSLFEAPQLPQEEEREATVLSTDSVVLKEFPRLQQQAPPRPSKAVISFSPPLSSIRTNSPYGQRFHPILKKWRFHAGVDLASQRDTVYSMLSGTVKESGYSSTLGYYIRTQHSSHHIEVLYAHLSEYYYLKGEPIRAGDPVGITGSTGLSTGDHLHLAVYVNGKHIDPIRFMTTIIHYNNEQKTYKNEQTTERGSDYRFKENIATAAGSGTDAASGRLSGNRTLGYEGYP